MEEVGLTGTSVRLRGAASPALSVPTGSGRSEKGQGVGHVEARMKMAVRSPPSVRGWGVGVKVARYTGRKGGLCLEAF